MIGQEELPLRAAMAARDEKQTRDTGASACQSIGSFEIPTNGIASLVAAERASPPSPASRGEQPQRWTKAEAKAADHEPEPPVALVQTRPVPGRGGRPAGMERYPFGALIPVTVSPAGEMIGPCFLIAESDDPARHISAARKRHAGKTFITRVVAGGTMVWRRK